jgi:hypothetical protein
MTVAEVYKSVTNGSASDFRALVRILKAHPPWCLVGGLALNCCLEPIAGTYLKLREKIPLEIVE